MIGGVFAQQGSGVLESVTMIVLSKPRHPLVVAAYRDARALYGDYLIEDRPALARSAAEQFGMEPGELMALVGGHTESLQEALAALREGKQAEDGVVHTLTRVWIRMAARPQTHAA